MLIPTAPETERLRHLHRPTDDATLAREVAKLQRQGLTERDIGQALRLDPTAVRRMVEQQP